MPVLYQTGPSRRNFIKMSLGSIGAIAIMGIMNHGSAAQENDVHWAFLSDTHIPEDVQNNYRGFYPYKNLQKVVPHIIETVTDGALITGDLARLEGKIGDYKNMRKLLDPVVQKMPLAMALGNHDNRKNFLQVFDNLAGQRQAVKDKYVLVIEYPSIRFILLDSLMFTNKTPGLLGKAQRQWLTSYLQTSDNRPTLLFEHHTLGDEDGDLLDVERLFAIIKPVRKVKALIFGHSHRYQFDEYDGIHLINLPAVGYNFNDHKPVGWVETHLNGKGGTFTLHAIGGNMAGDGKEKTVRWRL